MQQQYSTRKIVKVSLLLTPISKEKRPISEALTIFKTSTYFISSTNHHNHHRIDTMFVPVLDDEEDDEIRNHGEDEVVRVEFAEEMMGVVIIKISSLLLLLSLGVAAFIQFCTLEPRYVNSLMWGEESPYQTTNEQEDDLLLMGLRQDSNCSWTEEVPEYERDLLASTKSLRTLQSIAAISLLSFLRAVIFPNLYRNNNATTSTFEAVLADMLFHIKCRLGIGFLACVTPLSFAAIETTVVCLSVSLQMASLSV